MSYDICRLKKHGEHYTLFGDYRHSGGETLSGSGVDALVLMDPGSTNDGFIYDFESRGLMAFRWDETGNPMISDLDEYDKEFISLAYPDCVWDPDWWDKATLAEIYRAINPGTAA